MGKKISKEELKQLQIDILDHIDAFCRKHDINYSLAFGTLLGAVRHGGYIPWDDDIDIMMLREDYERFQELYLKENTSDIYELINSERTKGYSCYFIKIHDNRTLINEEYQYKDLGVNVDIFPIDALPCTRLGIFFLWIFNSFTFTLLTWNRSRKKQRSFLRTLIIRSATFLFPARYVKKVMDFVFKRIPKCPITGGASLHYWKFKQKQVPLAVFTELADIKFEDKSYVTIKDYHTYLSALYGDYMTPPPESQRIEYFHQISPMWKN